MAAEVQEQTRAVTFRAELKRTNSSSWQSTRPSSQPMTRWTPTGSAPSGALIQTSSFSMPMASTITVWRTG
jgi:hypothetical protein